MIVAGRGNFSVPFSTETHFAASIEALGHSVIRLNEETVGWADTIDACRRADVFWWTSTWGHAHRWDQDEAAAAVETINQMIPSFAFHLDLFFGLDRSDQPANEPWFRLRRVYTADGGHQQDFLEAGVEHRWLPPGVHAVECAPGRYRPELASRIAFVGSWQINPETGKTYYHPDSPHRQQLVEWLQQNYRAECRFWPEPGGRAVRGDRLRDLYASVEILVGDSCLAGVGARNYWSDRIPESLGRGGFLLHPWIEGIDDWYTDGEHLRLWEAGDWRQLRDLIDYYLARPQERARIAQAGRMLVLGRDTYAHRFQAIVDDLAADGLLDKEKIR